MKQLEETKEVKLDKKEVLVRKFQGCVCLSNLDKKKITRCDIAVMANKVGLSYDVFNHAWENFVQTGGRLVDRRVTNDLKNKNTLTTRPVPSHKGCSVKNNTITPERAGAIIKEYMKGDETSRQLSKKYNVSVNQFYDWIHELNVSGSILGKKILDTNKYAKLEVKDVIWKYKKPQTKRKSIASLSLGEMSAYNRVANVLLKYL